MAADPYRIGHFIDTALAPDRRRRTHAIIVVLGILIGGELGYVGRGTFDVAAVVAADTGLR